MAIKVRDYIAKLPVREQEAIKKEARKLILEEMSLSAIREARRHSQIELANKLGVQQPAVSKIEQQTDLYLSTLAITSRPWVANWKYSPGFPIATPFVSPSSSP